MYVTGTCVAKLDVHTQFRHNQGVCDYCIVVTVRFFIRLWCKQVAKYIGSASQLRPYTLDTGGKTERTYYCVAVLGLIPDLIL